MPSSDPHAQSDYQVRFDWGRRGSDRLAPAHVVVVVQTLGLTAHALSAVEHGAALDLAGDDDPAAALALAAEAAGAHVVVGGLRNAAAVADHVLAVQRARGERTSISIVAAGYPDGDEAVRFAVDDLLGAGAVIAALGDLGIDHASPDAAVAGEGFRALGGAVRHLLTASGTGRALAADGGRDGVLHAAARDAASVVPVLRDGVFGPA
ncbi:2-phosphosulfolactate phosphatase [Microbacterium sp. KSW2-21]|uniref:Probable 2-phosphosulfolactate phosphatase n=1 Tax=Microbacterium algihabitans TaxID=3075992 RepID=A0ABU3RT82_9MICO|nr:2-phosphosulfolactate phosphatase [Microbacterium sp. KSW2-21]MDU0325805.1 2-phosphosulfolactate phosphatase [Microbacterium sp. KSW2-21]